MCSTVIFIKTFNAALCRQEEFMYSLKGSTQMTLSH